VVPSGNAAPFIAGLAESHWTPPSRASRVSAFDSARTSSVSGRTKMPYGWSLSLFAIRKCPVGSEPASNLNPPSFAEDTAGINTIRKSHKEIRIHTMMLGDPIQARRSLGLLRNTDYTNESTHSDLADFIWH
jgi:hypothetical protein